MHAVLAATNTALSVTWTWYVIRAAGLTAMVLLGIVTVMGIGMVTGFTYRFIEPLRAWAIHRAMAIALMVAVLIHVGFLLIDHFAPYSFVDVTIPFAVGYEHSRLFGINAGSIYNAAGVIAAYLLVIVTISSLLYIETKKRLWRRLHWLSYPLMVLLFFHVLFLGTDFKHGIARLGWTVIGVVLLVGMLSRFRRSNPEVG